MSLSRGDLMVSWYDHDEACNNSEHLKKTS